jgi:hypothetical protein
MHRLSLALALAKLLLCCTSYGQVIVPREVDPYEPIVATCQNTSSQDTDVQIGWEVSSDKVQYKILDGPVQGDGAVLHIWAPPGEHWVEATVATQRFREIVVVVPDADDPTKTKTERVKIAVGFSVNRHKAGFTVGGAPPAPPGPGPGPGPGPTPTIPTPSAELQSIVAPIRAVMVKGDPAKAAVWASAWSDYWITLQVTPHKTLGDLKGSMKAFTDAAAIKAGLQGAFPGFGAAVEQAFVTRFGADDGALDAAKATEFIAALIWACQSK